ncbi:ATP-dependent DNA ligase [Streptomyces sp. NPDC059459]|uniref:ATP-dependent DNA ligase n=1 Tax=Streptomyces sp. NPDC059459 TaxID=3346839 RepID=UPI0036A180FF
MLPLASADLRCSQGSPARHTDVPCRRPPGRHTPTRQLPGRGPTGLGSCSRTPPARTDGMERVRTVVAHINGELVVWEGERLAFERLQQRLAHCRGAGARAAARAWPAHLVVFDATHLGGTDLTAWPYARRRAALEALFAEAALVAPFTLCPSTTDPATARAWLTWTSAGLEGLCFKRLSEPYRPEVRGWGKYKVRATEDAIVGAFTGPAAALRTLLLGRYDAEGRLRFTGRTTTLPQSAGRAVATLLTPARPAHPWAGWTFSAGWGSRDLLDVTLVQPRLGVEVGVDVARDAAGRWRHPARWHRPRPDLSPTDIPRFEPGPAG